MQFFRGLLFKNHTTNDTTKFWYSRNSTLTRDFNLMYDHGTIQKLFSDFTATHLKLLAKLNIIRLFRANKIMNILFLVIKW